MITTKEVAEETIRTKIYRVTGLVERYTAPALGQHEWQVGRQTRYDFDTLIENITYAIEPDSWEDLGGPGTLASHVTSSDQYLIVSQTDRVHKQVEIFLRRLHQLGRGGAMFVSRSWASRRPARLPEVGRGNTLPQRSKLPDNWR